MIVASLFEKRAPGLYHNTAAIIDADGSFLGKYRKMHIPDDPLFTRSSTSPRATSVQCWQTKFGRIGVLVCWDPWISRGGAPDGVARGADSLLSDRHRLASHREGKIRRAPALLLGNRPARSRAVANGCYVAAPNRIGHEAPDGGDGIEFWDRASSPTLPARSSRRLLWIRRRSSSPRSTSMWSTPSGRTGRSCATAASTPTATSRSAFHRLIRCRYVSGIPGRTTTGTSCVAGALVARSTG